MAERLNKVIGLIESGGVAFAPFAIAGSIPDATFYAGSGYDGCVFELEHQAFDLDALRLSLQFMLDRRQIVESKSLAPAVVPLVRIPINGRERVEWVVKQVLDIGVFGMVFPMINTPEDALHALSASRYPQSAGAADHWPTGHRGHAPGNACRYWGLPQPEYFEKADIWPMDPAGEILPLLQCETIEGVKNLPAILKATRNKPGLILISEGDLSVSLGHHGQYTTEVEQAVQEAAKICKDAGVPYGSPQVTAANVEQRIADGFQFLMAAPSRDTSLLAQGKRLAKR